MQLTEGTVVTVLLNLVFWGVQFAVLKTDTNWIKKSLISGDRKFRVHGRRLNTHQSEITSLKSNCMAKHPGTVFPQVENGGGGD